MPIHLQRLYTAFVSSPLPKCRLEVTSTLPTISENANLSLWLPYISISLHVLGRTESDPPSPSRNRFRYFSTSSKNMYYSIPEARLASVDWFYSLISLFSIQ